MPTLRFRQKVVHKLNNSGIIARPKTVIHPIKMKTTLIAAAEVDRLETWQRYTSNMCHGCHSTCCTLPVEVKIKDLIRIGVVDEFEKDESPKNVAKRLQKEGIIERFNQKSGIFTLTRMSNDDCMYLDRKSRLCNRCRYRNRVWRYRPCSWRR